MQKKNKKIIISIITIIAILLIILLSQTIIQAQNKRRLALLENTPDEAVEVKPNIPVLSAGMIPVKWDGEQWIITTSDDPDWYDYSQGKPAYIMLNDGYYKSELERGIKEEQLMQNNVGVGVPDDPSIRGTIFVWMPRFAYRSNGEGKIEIKYIEDDVHSGGGWTVFDTFSYNVENETKPNFLLSGVWIEKDVDTDWSNKVTEMNKEESVYGFIANTKAAQITTTDTTVLQKYIVGADESRRPQINDPTNLNRIILKIVNTTKHEPIKANITHNTVDKRIEIRVTYTANGISSILDEYGNAMTLTEENGIILADTGSVGLAKGTYYFTVIDNKGNKKELSITPNIDSLFKVAYIDGTDNMDNTATYNKTQEAKTTAENTLLNQIKATDTTKTFSRAIQDNNKAITAIGQQTRTAEDEKMYMYGKYKANEKSSYYIEVSSTSYTTSHKTLGYTPTRYKSYSLNSSTGIVTLSGKQEANYKEGTISYLNYVGVESSSSTNHDVNTSSTFYKFKYTGCVAGYLFNYEYWPCYIIETTTYSRGNFDSNVIALDGTYTIGSSTAVHSDKYWYTRNSLAPKYTLYKYDTDLNLKSTYDVDTKTLLTEPIDISNKGNNKVKLTLNTTGTDYKTYISNDNTNWQEVTDIKSGTPKELEVDGWDKLYVKVETNVNTTANTTRVNNIDIAYYKD